VAGVGDFLELLHRASSSYQTFRGEFRVIDQPDVSNRALRELRDVVERTPPPSREVQRGGSSGSFSGFFFIGASDEDDDATDEPSESLMRVWFDRGARRYREEEGEGEEQQLTVRDGRSWWSYDPFMGARSNEGEDASSRSTIGGSAEILLSPSKLLAVLQFEQVEPGDRGGRSMLRARAHRNPDARLPAAQGLSDFGWGADAYELEADAERGVLLRAVSYFKGDEMRVIEAIHVAFDEPLSADTFVFSSPDGSAPVSDNEPRDASIPIHQAAGLAPFAVFVLAGMPDGWTPFARFSPARQRPPSAAQVSLTYLAASGAGTVFVVQHREGDDHAPSEAGRLVEREVIRDGVTIEIVESTGEYRTVRLTRDGTRIGITSSDLSADELLELASRLRPAPSEPEQI
jgi:outer membrane lipoprotein-sorting protein